MINDKMKSVRFCPVVGEEYLVNGWNGIKLLILGESHYCNDQDATPDLTINVMQRYFGYKFRAEKHERWMNTYTKFANVLLGNEGILPNDFISFWKSIVFYNYVQTPTCGPRVSPTNDQFKSSECAFFEVIEVYRPDLIIVWGKRLWHNMPGNGNNDEEAKILDNAKGQFYNYQIQNKIIPAFKVSHPSSRYFNSSYSHYLKEAIRLVIEKNQQCPSCSKISTRTSIPTAIGTPDFPA